MKLRPATAADVDALALYSRETFARAFGHLYAAADLAAFFAEYRMPLRFAEMITDTAKLVTIADAAGRIAGYSTLELDSGFDARPYPQPQAPCILGQLYCDPGEGIGSALLAQAIAAAREHGRQAMQLSVYAENFGAQRFYQRHGFVHVADIDFWVGTHRDDEFLYELAL